MPTRPPESVTSLRPFQSAGLLGTLVLLSFVSIACSGTIDSPPRDHEQDAPAPPRNEPSFDDGLNLPESGLDCEVSPGPTPMRRLSSFEWQNAVRDLFTGVTLPDVSGDLAGDNIIERFDNHHGAQDVLDAQANGFMLAAERISEAATASLENLLVCEQASAGDPACAWSYLEALAGRAFRRPLQEDERERLRSGFEAAAAELPLRDAVRYGVELVVQSPQFLYRIETPTRGPGTLDDHQLAQRLSFLLWASVPDAELRAHADQGDLHTPSVWREQVDRMMADDRSRASFLHMFHLAYDLGGVAQAEKDSDKHAALTQEIASAMQRETDLFLQEVLFDEDATFATLFTARHAYRNEALDRFYGRNEASGDAFVRVAVDQRRAGGLLTLGGPMVLTGGRVDPDPIVRGAWVRVALMCEALPAPPPDVPVLQERAPGQSVREQHEAHFSSPACKGCHELIDYIGFGLQNLDSIGRWRDTDNGAPIDAQGALLDVNTGDNIAFDGPGELAALLSKSQSVRSCLAGNLFRFAFGRSPEAKDQCLIDRLTVALDHEETRFADLVRALTVSTTFTHGAANN